MNAVLLNIGIVIFIVYAVFNIVYLIDMRKTSIAMRQLIAKTGENLSPALEELTHAVADIRKMTEDASQLLEGFRAAVGAIITVEKGVQNVYHYYRTNFRQSAQSNVSGIKAGVRAGVVNFLSSLKNKKEGSS